VRTPSCCIFACPDDLPPCLRDPYFLFKTDDAHPAKHACIRPRGGARTRAPPRTPGDNTLPTRPTTRTTTTAPAAPRRLNLALDEAMSDLDHLVETSNELYSLDELVSIFESEAAEEAASAAAS
jgi:hypothetical protein